MTQRVLVAGIGNIFHGDDGFGVEVVRQLVQRPLPHQARVMDIGIRSIDLSFALLDGWELVILVDAAMQGHAPGTLYVLDLDDAAACESRALDAHSLPPHQVIADALARGGDIGCARLVGCEPARLPDADAGEPLSAALSPAVRNAVPGAVALVERLVRTHLEAAHA